MLHHVFKFFNPTQKYKKSSLYYQINFKLDLHSKYLLSKTDLKFTYYIKFLNHYNIDENVIVIIDEVNDLSKI